MNQKFFYRSLLSKHPPIFGGEERMGNLIYTGAGFIEAVAPYPPLWVKGASLKCSANRSFALMVRFKRLGDQGCFPFGDGEGMLHPHPLRGRGLLLPRPRRGRGWGLQNPAQKALPNPALWERADAIKSAPPLSSFSLYPPPQSCKGFYKPSPLNLLLHFLIRAASSTSPLGMWTGVAFPPHPLPLCFAGRLRYGMKQPPKPSRPMQK